MMSEPDRPLISFLILTYNQHDYVEDAIEGALSQTYSPLEIIVSDDNSTDKTFEKIRARIDGYDGPHAVQIRKNRENLGIGGHINRVMEIAKGELIVIGAGDDISMPDRTERIYDEWVDSDRSCFSIHSAARVIDHSGRVIGRKASPYFRDFDGTSWREEIVDAAKKVKYVFGATHAWSTQCFKEFGPLANGISCEDRVIPFRSLLLGKIKYIDDELVMWRAHQDNLSSRDEFIAKGYPYSLKVCQWNLESALQYRRDFLRFQQICVGYRNCDLRQVSKTIDSTIAESELRLNLMLGRGVFRATLDALSNGVCVSRIMKELLKITFRKSYKIYTRERSRLSEAQTRVDTR